MAVTRERVAEQLVALRRLHGSPDRPLSQEKAAQKAQVNTRDWSRWENRKSTPRTSSLSLIADAFEIPLDAFDDGAQPERSRTPLAERLDEINEKLDEILERLRRLPPAEPETPVDLPDEPEPPPAAEDVA